MRQMATNGYFRQINFDKRQLPFGWEIQPILGMYK